MTDIVYGFTYTITMKGKDMTFNQNSYELYCMKNHTLYQPTREMKVFVPVVKV